MSCTSDKCSCGSDCKCGSGCGCGMYPDLGVTESNMASETLIVGLAPSAKLYERSEMSYGEEGGNGCKCGASCSCDPCSCK
ncbi:Metallothionein-like protein 2 [Euphorbia peplus]|nr:Metallothionein-like protein 2 [Euphorbia peplus]